MKSSIRLFAVTIVAAIPSLSYAEEVVFSGLVMHAQYDDYAVSGTLNTNGSSARGYCLLYDAAGNYFLAMVTEAPAGAAKSNRNGAAARPNNSGAVPVQRIGSSAPPSSTGGNWPQQNGQSNHSNPQPATQGTGTHSTNAPQGHSSTGHHSQSAAGAAGTNTGSQITELNLTGTIVATNEDSALNSTITLQMNATSGAMTVTTSQGIDLTGQGIILTRPNRSAGQSTTGTANSAAHTRNSTQHR